VGKITVKKHTNCKVMGIDPSTKTGLALIADDHCATSVVSYPGSEGIHRLECLVSGVVQKLDAWKPDLVVIEGYGYANKYTLSLMVEIGVLIRMSLHTRGIPWYICPPSVLKKYATGNGAAKKPAVASAVKLRWGFDAPSDDVVDAYVLAQIAKELVVSGLSTGLKGVERG